MQDISEQIIQEATSLFLKYGIKSVTMDDISRSMSISKKTVYQYFHDKNEIVNKVAKYTWKLKNRTFEEIQANAENAIEKLYRHSLFLRRSFEKMNPVVLFDLKKYYKDAWQLFIDYKKDVFSKSMINTLKEGIRTGLFQGKYRSGNTHYAPFRSSATDSRRKHFSPDKYDFRDVQIQLFDHFIHGILTEKGHVLMNEYYKNHIQP
jgi:TetR/AcrR family transcriptional regulator, cholesterol catabolism regulator